MKRQHRAASVWRGGERSAVELARLILAVALILSVIDTSAPVRAQPPDFKRTVRDLTGRPVTIYARPQIIAVVGGDPAAERVIPPEDRRIIDPVIDPAVVEWRAIGLLLIPDLYAAAYPAMIDAAEAARVPVFRTTAITSLAMWRAAVTQIGAATGREDRAADLMLQLDRRLALVWTAVGDQLAVRALVLTPEGYTFGQGAWITELIAAAGGINAAAEAGFADYRQIADSTIRELAPDVILLSPAWDRATFLEIAAYADLPAVQSGRVYQLLFAPTQPDDPGAAVRALAWALHPRAMWRAWRSGVSQESRP
jgi:ABC-type Fe3+-hydroxamate transport system substrate-binding protein